MPADARSPSPERSIRVLIVDDHRAFAESLRTVIDLERGITVVGLAHDGEEAVEIVRREDPDVVLMDLAMPGVDGVAATRRIREEHPDVRVVVLSALEEETVLDRALDAGAVGFVSKIRSVEEVTGSVRAAHAGEQLLPEERIRQAKVRTRRRREADADEQARLERLTNREVQVLTAVARGLSLDDLAEELGISRHTARTHVQNVLVKLRVHSKLEAVAMAVRHGRIELGTA